MISLPSPRTRPAGPPIRGPRPGRGAVRSMGPGLHRDDETGPGIACSSCATGGRRRRKRTPFAVPGRDLPLGACLESRAPSVPRTKRVGRRASRCKASGVGRTGPIGATAAADALRAGCPACRVQSESDADRAGARRALSAGQAPFPRPLRHRVCARRRSFLHPCAPPSAHAAGHGGTPSARRRCRPVRGLSGSHGPGARLPE